MRAAQHYHFLNQDRLMQFKAPQENSGRQDGYSSPVSIPHPSRRLSRGMRLAMADRSLALVLDVGTAFLAFVMAYFLRYRLEIGGDIPFWAEEAVLDVF